NRHVVPIAIDDDETILMGCDFNVGNTNAVLGVRRGRELFIFDEIAADRCVGGPGLDVGRSRAAQILMDTTTYPNMQQRLEGMATSKDSTFRQSARELLALSAWHANDATAARQWLDQIANDGETPPSLRSRAEALQALLPPVAKS
ncbi:MAG: hypothetical protein ACK5DO_15510, partial [Bradyrhizobium sp.]